MAKRPLTKSAFYALLLVAFLHQMSACACGCLEHNAWFQAARALGGAGHGHSHQWPQDNGDPEDDTADHKHCESEMLVYRKAQTVLGSQQDVRLVEVTLAVCRTAAPGYPRATSSQLRDFAAQFPALDVRAQWQVMLI